MSSAVEFPKPKPMLEVARLNSQRQMRRRKTTRILRRSSGLAGPEFGDVFQMSRPVLDARVKDGAEHGVLPDIDIKRLDEPEDSVVPAQAVVQGLRFAFCHRSPRSNQSLGPTSPCYERRGAILPDLPRLPNSGIVALCRRTTQNRLTARNAFTGNSRARAGWMTPSSGNMRCSSRCPHRNDASSASRQPAQRFP
jgi:hypothetical protein